MEGEELVQSLRELMVSFKPHIHQAGSLEQAQEVILHLESNDDNFEKYQYVRSLRQKVTSCLGSLIDDHLRSSNIQDPNTHQESLVNKVIDEVIRSKEYQMLTEELKGKVTAACDVLLENFDEEFCTPQESRESEEGRRSDPFSDGDSSFGSSFNQSTFCFMTPEQIHTAINNLDKKKSLETRKDALKQLSYVQPNELVCSDDRGNCPSIRNGLIAALADCDDNFSNQALKFIGRGFTSASLHNKEFYNTLVQYILNYFKDHEKTGSLPKLRSGVNLKRLELMKIMKAIRLMNEFQRHIPSYWVRFSEGFLREVLEITLKLFSFNPPTPVAAPAPLTPLHLLALVDPKADWFIKWMHASYARMPLLQLLQRYKVVIESAVRHCMDFINTRRVPLDLLSDISDSQSRITGSESIHGSIRLFYTGQELEYVYFVHSLTILGRLLWYSQGRRMFPMKVSDRSDPVTITELVVAMIQLVQDPSTIHFTNISKAEGGQYEPGVLAAEVLKNLCSEAVCASCMCKDEIINRLLAPVAQWLDGATDHGVHQASEATYLHIADILSMVASSTEGRRHLMYGENVERFTRSSNQQIAPKRSSAAYIIAEFAKKAITGNLPKEFGPPPSNAVIGAYIYMCRQLYNTGEGLHVLYPYDLHSCIAAAWKKVSQDTDRSSTPTQEKENEGGFIASVENAEQWEDTLLDNLLNFAGTPKGLLLLQQSGAINECVSYMYARYAKKLQVSKCEKFGYGTMVTQVAATAPGMVALQSTGFIKALVNELWSVLECGADDIPSGSPKTWPVDPIDRTAHKSFTNLLNVLSAFPAVYEVLAERSLPVKDSYSFREMPDTIAGFIDRLVLVDSPVKIHSLFNYEQSHMFGLRVLSVMTCCLDTFLLLDSQYKVLDSLLSCQKANVAEENGGDIIIDMLSVERNFILVKTHIVGGPSERVLPNRTLSDDPDNLFPYPLFSSYPLPREYLPNIAGRSAMKQENELTRFLNDTRNSDHGHAWLDKCRKTLCTLLTTRPDHLKGNLIQDLLEQVVQVMVNIPEEAIFPLLEYSAMDSGLKSYQLTSLQKQGVKLAVGYGSHLKAVSNQPETTDHLRQLLRQCGYYLSQQQKRVETSLRSLQSGYVGYDWFASTIFLLMHGSLDRSWKFLYQFTALGSSGYLWGQRLHSSVHLPPRLAASGISPLYSSTCHNVDLILQAEVPLVYSAFKMSGYTSSQICQHWLRQCFWNYLDWPDICHYIVLCIVLGVDYQVYMCVAICRFLMRDILMQHQKGSLLSFLKEEPIKNFKVGEQLEFMQQLEEKYRKTILTDMLNLSKP